MSEYMSQIILSQKLAQQEHISKAVADSIIKAVGKAATDLLLKKRKVTIIGLGSFTLEKSPAKMVRHPVTKEMIEIPQRGRIKFMPCMALREELKNIWN